MSIVLCLICGSHGSLSLHLAYAFFGKNTTEVIYCVSGSTWHLLSVTSDANLDYLMKVELPVPQ